MALSSIISMIPTIGNIVGGLLGEIFKGNESSSKRYSIMLGSSPMNQVDFKVENNSIVLGNRTEDDICLSFPSQNGYTGETIIVPSCSKLPVTGVLKNCTANDVDAFNLTAGTPSPNKNGFYSNQKMISIASSGMVQIGGDTKTLGSYIRTKVTKDAIELSLPSNYSMSEVISLNITPAEGNQVCCINNYHLDTKDNKVTFPLSLLLVEGKQVEVSATVSCVPENYSEMIQNNNKKYGITQMTRAEMDDIAKMTNINIR